MNFKKLLLLIPLFVIFSSLSAVVSYNDAKNMVLKQIISKDVGEVNVYGKTNQVSKTTGLDLHKNRNISLTYNTSWIFFVNDSPDAKWCHPVRYIAIDSQSGSYEILDESIYPASSHTDFELISSPPNPTPFTPQVTPVTTTTTLRIENGKLHAVIIGGDEVGVGLAGWDDDECFWNDVSGVYCTLLEYGYSRDNIIVHYAEGEGPDNNQDLDEPILDPTDDIDFDADKTQIISTFNNLASTLTPEDMLFVYLNDHGELDNNDVYLMLPGDDIPANRLYDHEIATLTRNIDCAQMVFLIDCCYSGGFIDDLDDSTALCQNRVVHTNGGLDSTYGERWITAPASGQASKYTEFTLYWTAALRENYPYINPQNTQEIYAWQENEPVGTFPFTDYSGWNNHMNYPNHNNYPDYHPDTEDGSNDSFVQMVEAFRYANNWDSFSNDTAETYNGLSGYFNPHRDISLTRLAETPMQFPASNTAFLNKYLTLAGISGTLRYSDYGSSVTLTGNYLFTEEFKIEDGVTLTLSAGSKITLTDDCNFVLEDGAELIIENGADISLGENVVFSTPTGQASGSVRLQGCSPINGVNLSFTNCKLYTTDTRVYLNGGSFTDSYLKHLDETLIINDVDFDQTKIYAEIRTLGGSSRLFIQIQDCLIENSNDDAIFISSYPSFKLKNNTITDNQETAINLYQCDNGFIENNTIVDNGAGIYLNNTEVEITNHNSIKTNDEHGIVALNYSNWSLVGQNDYPCQTIYDNYGNNPEIWFSTTSQPDQVLYNKIYDSNLSSVFIYCSGTPAHNIDVTNNYWGVGASGGTSRIPVTANLTPFTSFDYNPVWNPGQPRGGVDLSAEIMYLEAKEYETNEEYTVAEITYKSVITQYPSSTYSKMAAKQLFSLEEITDQDFVTLKAYYDTEPNMTYDSEMTKVSAILSNQCSIKNSEFPTAIDFYEEIIVNPATPVDSVMAVIDLGHTYLLMEENGNRSNYTGKLANLKPESWQEFENNRTQLLNNLFGENPTEENENEVYENIPECVILNGNYPNPFNPTTSISFSIPSESMVDVSIYNVRGQKVKTILAENLTKGEHQAVWSGLDHSDKPVSSGVYFYKLSVNGKSESIKKCLLLK